MAETLNTYTTERGVIFTMDCRGRGTGRKGKLTW